MRIHQHNTSEPQGLVYVNRRIHSIPATVIDVNQTAHEAIMAYNQANNLSNSPWLYYKLVNVQSQPIDKPTPGVDYTAPDAATYYQANIVVETDYNLQVFSGRFQQGNQGIPTTLCQVARRCTTRPIPATPRTFMA